MCCSLLDSEREQISDAAAVYFLMPSQENIDRICRDFRAQVYESYYFNFITPIPRDMLEQLAKVAVDTNLVSQISKVLDKAVLLAAQFANILWTMSFNPTDF